jgi:hypothetical protein
MLNNILKIFDDFSKNRKTREKVIIKTFAKDNVDLDYANRWNAPLFKKKVKTKNMLIINSFLICLIIFLIFK